jgi:hypothetical protein
MTLWCVHIPGPDDLHAAPDRATAKRMASEHNTWLDQKYWEESINFGGDWPTRVACTAVVIEWPWSAESHATALMREEAERG